MLDNGQPQAGTAGTGAAAFIDTVKALGDPAQMALLDTQAAIRHRQTQRIALALPAHRHGLVLLAVFQRIDDQIRHSAAQFRVVAADAGAGFQLQHHQPLRLA